MLEGIFLTVVNMSIIGSLAIILILAVRLLLLKAPKVFSYCLWAVVLFRLLVPFSFDSVVSLIPINKQPVPLNLVSMQTPAINTGIASVDEAVSSVLPYATNVDGTSMLPQLISIVESIWLVGMLSMVAFGVYSLFKLKNKLRSAANIENNIYQSEHVETPFVLGMFRPKVYLPAGLNEIEREYILLHEQNHIRRGDHIIRIVSYLALCVHWFNPLVWVAFKISGKDMEMANDESVIREKGDSIKKAYSSSLLTLSTGKRSISPVPLAFGEEDPKGRIENIIKYKKPVIGVVLAAVVVVVAVSAGLLLSSYDDKPSSQEVAAAQSVVEEYFRACEVKDSQAILKTLTPESVSPNTQLFGKETKTLLTIDYNPEDSKRQTYITSGRGSLYDIREENVIIFRVSFNIEYPEGVIGVWNEGKYEDWSVILIRDDKDSPWLIDDQGM